MTASDDEADDLGAAWRRWPGAPWLIVAACIAAALIIGRVTAPGPGPFVLRDEGIYARGKLAHVLSTQLAAAQSPNLETRIGQSFRTREGGFCRTFIYNRTVSGLACKEERGWNVRVTSQESDPRAAYAQPAAPAVLETLQSLIDGDPLDAEGEAEAQRADWR